MAGKQKTERVQLLMTPSEVKGVDDWSFEQRIRGRSEAIRRLIELGRAALNVHTDELGEQIDEWRRHQPDVPSRAEAAQRLIQLGLEAEWKQQNGDEGI